MRDITLDITKRGTHTDLVSCLSYHQFLSLVSAKPLAATHAPMPFSLPASWTIRDTALSSIYQGCFCLHHPSEFLLGERCAVPTIHSRGLNIMHRHTCKVVLDFLFLSQMLIRNTPDDHSHGLRGRRHQQGIRNCFRV